MKYVKKIIFVLVQIVPFIILFDFLINAKEIERGVLNLKFWVFGPFVWICLIIVNIVLENWNWKILLSLGLFPIVFYPYISMVISLIY
jgi:hypothetical protein